MILYPAIDLKDGKCVRLLHGDMDKATVFNASPAAQAASFQAAGFEYLHMVDLNGAIEGRNVNGAAVRAVLQTVSMPVQIGGGIRSLANVEDWLEAGVARVILGTAAVRDPGLVREAARRFPGKVAVGIDARDGMVATQGWVETSNVTVVELAKKFEDAGVAAIIFTDIGRDGALVGANVEATGELADAVSIPVIASGGVASVQDIVDLKAHKGTPISGVILGRSVYVGAIKPSEALEIARA